MRESKLQAFFKFREQSYKSTMWSVQKTYQIEEMLLDAVSDPLGHMLDMFKDADKKTVKEAYNVVKTFDAEKLQALASQDDDINEAALAGVLSSLIQGLRRQGGFFAVMQLILSDTKIVDEAGKASPIDYAKMRSRRVELEDLMLQVLVFNLQDYFLERVAQVSQSFSDSLRPHLDKLAINIEE